MDEGLEPVEWDSKVCGAIPCIRDKWVVDFVNGIHVAKGQLREQEYRKGFGSRFYDGLTGQSAKRQRDINHRVVDALKGSLQWLTELTEDLASTNRVVAQHSVALARIEGAVKRLEHHLASLALQAATRRELKHLANKVNLRFGEVERWIARVEAKADAKIDLDRVFSKWKAGEYHGLSILGQCYAALEELRWGDFGYYFQSHSANTKGLLEALEYEAISQISAIAGGMPKEESVETTNWLRQPEEPLLDGAEALAYLGEDYAPRLFPFVSVVTQSPPIEAWSKDVPLIVSSERAARTLVDEIFRERQHG